VSVVGVEDDSPISLQPKNRLKVTKDSGSAGRGGGETRKISDGFHPGVPEPKDINETLLERRVC